MASSDAALNRANGNLGRLRPYFTKHAQKRLLERFRKRFSKEAVDAALWNDYSLLLRETFALFREAEERRQIFNDTRFMTYVYETYGYDKRFVFIANGELVFVCVEDHEKMRLFVVTVVDSTAGLGSYTLRNMGTRVKFGRRTSAA